MVKKSINRTLDISKHIKVLIMSNLQGTIPEKPERNGRNIERRLFDVVYKRLRVENRLTSLVVISIFEEWKTLESICSINSLAAVLPI